MFAYEGPYRRIGAQLWVFFASVGLLAMAQAEALTVLHDESIDGDLGNPVTSPLTFSLAPGTSRVIGAFSVDEGPPFTIDSDGFRIDIGAGLRLTSIDVAYRFTPEPDFIGVTAFLVDAVTFSNVIASAALSDAGSSPANVFSGSLGPDVFAIGFNAFVFTGGNAFGTGTLDYQFDLEVAAIPAPPAVWLLGSALGLLGWLRKSQNITQG